MDRHRVRVNRTPARHPVAVATIARSDLAYQRRRRPAEDLFRPLSVLGRIAWGAPTHPAGCPATRAGAGLRCGTYRPFQPRRPLEHGKRPKNFKPWKRRRRPKPPWRWIW